MAGIYGLLILAPGYFMEEQVAVSMFAFSLVDALLAVLFATAYWQTGPRPMPG